MEKVPPPFPRESIPGDTHTSRHNEYELDVYKLIHLTQELPETTVAIAEYEKEFDDPCWTDSSEKRITPRMVIELYMGGGFDTAVATHPELAKHLQKIAHVDYSHPVLIFESKIIDGMHRLAKAYAEGQTLIKAKIITEVPEGAIIKRHPRK